MVVRLRQGKSIRGALSYNERKVRLNKAEVLLASGFSCDIDLLGFTQKLERFESLNIRREKIKINTLHLSINFPPGESPTDEVLRRVAMEYMERIGFGEQPYIVYKHKDAGHDHIHIVTTVIQKNGKVISLHNLAPQKSEPARKALELEFNLIRAEDKGRNRLSDDVDASIQPVQYTKAEVKNHITNVIGEVMRTYKFTSFEEFNAILRHFNVTADRGLEGSQMRSRGGLSYSMIDADGFKIGNSFKASSIYGKPTMTTLEAKFPKNVGKRQISLVYSKRSIVQLTKSCRSVQDLEEKLRKSEIFLIVDRSANNPGNNAFFFDKRNRLVFSDHDLDQPISRLLLDDAKKGKTLDAQDQAPRKQDTATDHSFIELPLQPSLSALTNILFSGASPADAPAGSPIDPKKRKKKKRRGPSS